MHLTKRKKKAALKCVASCGPLLPKPDVAAPVRDSVKPEDVMSPSLSRGHCLSVTV